MTDIAYHPTRLRALRDQFRALRAAEFPWTADTVYLNNASIGPIPERTRRVLDEFTAKRTAPHLLPDRELQAGVQAARVAGAPPPHPGAPPDPAPPENRFRADPPGPRPPPPPRAA